MTQHSSNEILSDKNNQLSFYQIWEPVIRRITDGCIHYGSYDLSAEVSIITGGTSPLDPWVDAPMKFDELAEHILQNLVHPADRRDCGRDFDSASLIARFHEGNDYFRNTHRLLQGDGTYLWCERSVQLFSDTQSGHILCMVMIRKASDTLARLQDELMAGAYELVSSSVPGGIIGMYNKPGFPVYYINDHMLSFLGYGRDEFMAASGGETVKIIHPDDYHRTGRAIAQAIRLKESFELQIRIIKKDQSIGWVIIRGKRNDNTDSNVNLLMCHFTDVTRMVSLQEELQEAAAAASDASRMKSTFLANMSHEIRTPMNGILGFVELALDEPGLSRNTADHLEKIRISTEGLLAVINDILDISKIEAGKLNIEHVAFNIQDVLAHCENICRLKSDEKNLELTLIAEPSVRKKRLVGDPNKLTQVLINLLSNAIKFTERGFVKLEARLADTYENMVQIDFSVRDSGIGMTDRQLEHIFAPFIQGDQSTTRKYGGTGLGLSISRDIVNLMGGTLTAESELGIGSTFRFDLTLESAGDITTPPVGIANALVAKPRFTGEILVCEDNVINQHVVVEHLARIGLASVIAANGEIAVEMVTERLLAGQYYDLILMDIHMPVMDGIEATQKILSLGVTTPIIAMTANAMKRDRENYLTLGMSDYIAKPFYAQELWACLLKYLTPADDGNEKDTRQAAAPVEAAIDYAMGLKQSINDKTLYAGLRQTFYQENAHRFEEMAGLLASGDTAGAKRLIHTLKSDSSWIGATALSRISAELEASLVEEGICSREQMEKLAAELQRALAELALDANTATPD